MSRIDRCPHGFNWGMCADCQKAWQLALLTPEQKKLAIFYGAYTKDALIEAQALELAERNLRAARK